MKNVRSIVSEWPMQLLELVVRLKRLRGQFESIQAGLKEGGLDRLREARKKQKVA